MTRPISPPAIKGGAKGELPAYLSNGVIGLRVRDNPLAAGMALVSGLTGRHPVRKIEAAALAPYPVALDLAIDGVWASDATHAIQCLEQSYDFGTAELTTRLVYAPNGVQATLEVVTFCSRDHPTLVCQQVKLTVSEACAVTLRPMIDSRGVPGAELASERHTPGEDQPACDGFLLWETAGANSTCGLAMSTSFRGAEATATFPPSQRGRFYSEYEFRARSDRTYRLDQLTSVVPSALHAQPDQNAVRLVALASRCGWDELRADNRKQWEDLWRGRILLVGAEPRWQALADAAFFYVMTSAHASSPSSTSMFGLATWGDYHYYYGHVMWDVESFAVPPLTFLQPAAAEALLDYRSNNLDAARKNALSRGRRGLQFPWESGPSSGEEAAPLPGTASWHEDHITPDVARAFAHYAMVAGREDFLRERAWPVLSGAADWIASRTTPTKRGHAILASMGIAERQAESDNPAFAIMACQAALDDALAAAAKLGREAAASWKDIRDNLAVPLRGKLLVSHDGYRANEEKGATPDPLMAIFPLWRDLGTEIETATLAHYLNLAEAYIGSPMLSAFYGVWAAWSGDRELSARLLDEGYGQFEAGRFSQILEYHPDRFPEQPKAGPFGANMGGFLMSLIQGFPALRASYDEPETWPQRPVQLPAGWSAIRCESLWIRGRRFRLEACQGAERAVLTPH